MYARLTFTLLLDLAFFICSGQDTLGVYKEVIPGITSCETINFREKAEFGDITFENDARFLCNRFINTADFRSVQFKSFAGFNNAQFETRAYFRLAQFDFWADFRSVQFKSLADFYDTQFNARVYFRLAQFDSRADFRSVQFKSLADFYDTQFNARVYFRLAQFDSLTDFSSAHFYAQANFSSVYFHAQADFRNIQFDDKSDFNLAQFHSRADFYNSHFLGLANFSATYFYARTNFRLAQFDSRADFRSARFDSRVDFSSVHFKGQADFRNAHFQSRAYFSKASFHGETNFRGVILPDTLYFNDISEIHEDEIIDFTFCKLDTFQTSCNINLVDTEINQIKLNYHHFQLVFPDTNYTFEEKCITYEQLLKTQKDYGFAYGYEKLDKEYQEFKYLHHPSNNLSLMSRYVNYVANAFNKHWWDYSYYKAKVLWWSLFFWFVFSIINWLLFNKMNEGVYKIDYIYKPNKDYARYLRIGNNRYQCKFNISLQQLVPAIIYTGLLFFGVKMSVEKINYKNKKGVLYIYFQYILGLVCLAFIANFVVLSN